MDNTNTPQGDMKAKERFDMTGKEKVWTLLELETIRREVNERCLAECWKKSNHGCLLECAEMYDHEGGWLVEGRKERQWVYFHCSRCGYDWSFNKILRRLEE